MFLHVFARFNAQLTHSFDQFLLRKLRLFFSILVQRSTLEDAATTEQRGSRRRCAATQELHIDAVVRLDEAHLRGKRSPR